MAKPKQGSQTGTPVPHEQATEFPLLKEDFVPAVDAKTTATDGDAAPTAAAALPKLPAQDVDEPKSKLGRFAEPPETPILIPRRTLQIASRRDFLIYGAGVAAAAAGFWWLLPDDTRGRILHPRGVRVANRLDAHLGLSGARKAAFLNGVLTFDDDVAEALYSPGRIVPTYDKSQADPHLRNNYDGQTPDPGYIDGWTLTLDGLASGKPVTVTIQDLLQNFGRHEQVTRLCCVEGWSAIAWWAGLRFADLLLRYPPVPAARWAKIESSVNLDSDGNSDPYYVSIDLPTARHPQTLFATHYNGQSLDVDHGAPLRLVAPMKLGLKNIKAVTAITYSADEPADYWNERGYSKYDGL
jgi:hypothetical protein